MDTQQADIFQGSLLSAVHGVAVEQATIGALSTALIHVDLSAILPMAGLTLGPIVYLRTQPDPVQRVLTVTHESEHVVQFWKDPLRLEWLYITEPEARVVYEVDAKRASMEVMNMLGLVLPTQAELEAHLRSGYQLNEPSIKLGMELFEVALTSVEAGVVSTTSAFHARLILRGLGVV